MSNLPAPTGSNPKPGSTTPASAPVTHSYENYSSDQLEPLLADASSTLESLKTAANPAYAELIKSNAEKVSTLEQALIRAFRREKIAKFRSNQSIQNRSLFPVSRTNGKEECNSMFQICRRLPRVHRKN